MIYGEIGCRICYEQFYDNWRAIECMIERKGGYTVWEDEERDWLREGYTRTAQGVYTCGANRREVTSVCVCDIEVRTDGRGAIVARIQTGAISYPGLARKNFSPAV